MVAREELSHRLISWLSASDPSTNLNSVRDKRQDDTGIWLLENSLFLDWRGGTCPFLWLYGKADPGKTIISSTAIDSLLEGKDPEATVVYFDFDTREKQLSQSSLSSMLVQLFRKDNENLRGT